jgi:hypothetical protein
MTGLLDGRQMAGPIIERRRHRPDHPAASASATMSAAITMKAAASKSDMSSGQRSHHVTATGTSHLR